MVLDPVFLYIPVTNDGKKCFQFDRWVMSVAIAERSAFGIWYLTNRTSEIRESIHRNYSKSLLPVFLLDLAIILPLPQVLVLLAYSQRISGQEFFSLMNLFLVQHGLKVIRLAKLITEWKNSYNLNKWANLTFNFGYLHAANVFGSLWYFFAVQRKAECWKKACTDFTRCGLLPLHCDDSLTNYTFSSDFCSTKTQNATIYDFGIFRDAIQSGVLDQNNFFRSCFGQGLPLSTNVLENIFVISITITGVVLFFFLIGKVQGPTELLFRLSIIIIIVYGAHDEDDFSEEGTWRLVSGVEMNRTSRSMRGVREITVCGVPFLCIPRDPVFLFIPVTNDEKKCFQFDRWVMSVVIAERSAFGIWYLTNRTSEIRESIHRNYSKYLSPVFLLDLSIILPLPQVLVLLAYSQRISGQEFFSLMNLFLVQHGLKVIRLAKLITEWKNSYNLNKWANLTFNFGYLHAANVFGSLWYFFAIQRKAECWNKACTDFTRCGLLPLHCDDSLTNYTFSSDFCSTKTQNATIYDFGLFRDAIQSGVLDQNNFFRSCFGQGLPLSTNVLENIFVISITLTGVVLFFLLIGKVQSETSKVYEIRQKVREIDRWLPFGKLPKKLQKEIKEYQTSKLQTTGVDVEYMVNHLPRHLRKNIKQKLCLDLLKKADRDSSNLPISTKTIRALTKVEAFVLMADDLKQ
ncbi:hypothetical protein CUMW_090100, partial [Citrus unshiu]